ncbi:hypothetical protein ASJ33_00910 [Dehalococcoides mccartyi]|jgi:hypothetical protein|uniref:hypothetical protein n=1 Tax=Dehalococcoides mccartyi TaxID=61435 RepID=UPI0004E06C59|nr:hypothetical protein [Dehalococcoides mccartyi]AII58651.1 hypothetical protein X792_00570 [Dehalococcoides mccartyi CG1]APH11808.1 hypothetical protein ASJ33_00910 [Dehalococcoides mccartyi]
MFQHERRLDDYDYFINDYNINWDTLSFHDGIKLIMHLECTSNLVITIEKFAKITSDMIAGQYIYFAQTHTYSYNVSIRDIGNCFRYDNCHKHRNHQTEHHLHVYSQPGKGEKDGSPICLGDDWPHMHEVIEDSIHYLASI